VERKINARIIVQILGCHLKAILLGIVPLRSTVVMRRLHSELRRSVMTTDRDEKLLDLTLEGGCSVYVCLGHGHINDDCRRVLALALVNSLPPIRADLLA